MLIFLLLFAGKAKMFAGLAVVASWYGFLLCARCGSYQLPSE